MDDHIFTSFESFHAAQASLSAFFQKNSPRFGPASDEITLEYMNKCEVLRDRMRYEFQLSEAKRKADLLATRVEEEKVRATQEMKVMNEQMHQLKEEVARQKTLALEALQQETNRMAAMEKEAKKRDLNHQALINSLKAQNEVQLAEMEKRIREEAKKTLEEERNRFAEQQALIQSKLDEKDEELRELEEQNKKKIELLNTKYDNLEKQKPTVITIYQKEEPRGPIITLLEKVLNIPRCWR